MKPITQTRLFSPRTERKCPGNCFASCVASILELSLEDVPDEAVHWKIDTIEDYLESIENSWSRHWNDIMKFLEKRNLTLIEIYIDNIKKDTWTDGYCIISGKSPRNSGLHAVVGFGDKIVHDPHPDNSGLDGKPRDWTYMFFVSLDPSK